MEHTGVYQAHLVSFLYEKDWGIWLENPTQIKFSMGLLGGTPQRGKNDKIDAKRIAIYASKNRQDLKLWTPKRYKITFLGELLALKDRLVRTRSSLVVPIGEQKPFWDSKLSADITPYAECRPSEKVIAELNTQITTIGWHSVGCMNFAKLKGKADIFREYYQRKVAEGKNKMAVINALRNKLVHTIFALVKKGEKFVNSLNNLQNNLVLP